MNTLNDITRVLAVVEQIAAVVRDLAQRHTEADCECCVCWNLKAAAEAITNATESLAWAADDARTAALVCPRCGSRKTTIITEPVDDGEGTARCRECKAEMLIRLARTGDEDQDR